MAAGLLLVASIVRYGVEVTTRTAPMAWDSTGVLPELLEDSRREGVLSEVRRRPLAPGELVDPNRASEETLDRLPGVGAGLAAAIVKERQVGGGYHKADDLGRVRGVGDVTLERLRPHLDFSQGVPSHLLRTRVPRSPSQGSVSRSSPRPQPAAGVLVDVNHADSTALATLPGIGPALAGRIIRERMVGGAFRSVEDLTRVRGIGPATVGRLRALASAGPPRLP